MIWYVRECVIEGGWTSFIHVPPAGSCSVCSIMRSPRVPRLLQRAYVRGLEESLPTH